MISKKFSGAILEFSPVSWEMGHSTLSLPFLGLIFWFLIDTSAFRQKFKNRSAKFLVKYPERLCFKFQTYILTLCWENRANITFHLVKNVKTGKNCQKRSYFLQVSYITNMILSVVPQRVSISNLRSFQALV